MNHDYLTTQEVRDYLRISRSTLERMVKGGQLPSYRVGTGLRFKSEDVHACVVPNTRDNVVLMKRGRRRGE